MRWTLAVCLATGLAVLAGCGGEVQGKKAEQKNPPIFFANITSGTNDVHPVTMALQLAGHALDDGRKVVLFFNVRGVDVPTTKLPDDLAFHDKPVKKLLTDLIDRGAEVHVCPHCMKALGIDAKDLLPGVQVTNREKLFANLGPNTNVFSY
ncbi:MAG: DsrE family protein [Pirellulales bacterium]|nr:DsrE family protein [Pirellulales bacterium]